MIFGDVVASRSQAARATGWLRALRDELDAAFGDVRLAPFAFTQGDELQGLLRVDADPFAVVLRAGLADGGLPMRWAIAAGRVDAGSGPATERTGEAFLAARALATANRVRRELLAARAGDPAADDLLADLAPLLGVLIRDLSDRQRAAARGILVDGRRRSEVAAELGVARATLSVLAGRGRVREIEGLHRVLATLFRRGVETVAT